MESLVFSGVSYKIDVVPSLVNLGETDKDACIIRLRSGMTRSKLYSVLLHEALHALLDEYAVFKESLLEHQEAEEEVVRRLTNALIGLIRENTELVADLLMVFGDKTKLLVYLQTQEGSHDVRSGLDSEGV